MDYNGRGSRKGAGLSDEMLPKVAEHLTQRPCHQLKFSQKDRNSPKFEKYGELLTLVKKRELRWFDYISRSGLAKTILQGTVKGKEEMVDRRSGKTLIRSGQGWILLTQLEQLKIGLGGKDLL